MKLTLPGFLTAMAFIAAAMWPTVLWARPPSAEESARRKAKIVQIQKSLEEEEA